MQYIGHPVLGDSTYGPRPVYTVKTIGFRTLISNFPESFQQALEIFLD